MAGKVKEQKIRFTVNALHVLEQLAAATFMAKLYAVRDEIRKERKGGEE